MQGSEARRRGVWEGVGQGAWNVEEAWGRLRRQPMGPHLRPTIPAVRALALMGLVFLSACRPSDSENPSAGEVHAAVDLPDVFLVVVDGLRADHVGAWGQQKGLTPNLDELAGRGWRVADVMSSASWSAPALASVLGGRYPSRLRDPGNRRGFEFDAATLQERLAAEGWHTAAVVSHEWVRAEQGFEQGFDRFVEVGLADSDEDPSEVAPARRTASQVTEAALRLVDDAGARPVFLLVHYSDPLPGWPHDPAHDFTEPAYAGALTDASDWREVLRVSGNLGPEDRQHLAALYAGEVAATDEELGHLFRGLEDRGRLAGGYLVVTSTAGVELFDHGGLGDQKTLYDELVHVPLVAFGPRLDPRRVDTTASLVDLGPTLLSWLGLPEWDGYDGEIIDPDQLWSERVLFLETDRARQLRGVTKGTWKLIEDREREVQELYELRSDPAEARDLVERSSRKAEDLGGLIDAFFGPGGSAGE